MENKSSDVHILIWGRCTGKTALQKKVQAEIEKKGNTYLIIRET